MTMRRRCMKSFGSTAALWFAYGTVMRACPICFQVDGGPVVDGVRAAVIVLVAITGTVLIGFASFAARVARRQKDQ